MRSRGLNSLPASLQGAPSEVGGTQSGSRASRPSDYTPFPVPPLSAAMLAFVGTICAVRGWRYGPDWLFLAGMVGLVVGGAGLGVVAGLALMN
ncbi:MAG: hypothetical protein JO227_12985 [Acetobacteraceae bacterium]|nr:hypothetical protein [Acetobacteraceae bacterium]